MIRHVVTVSAGTLSSRLLGFVRDAMIAALLGAGPVADAFLVAFQLVNVVRRLLVEGALNAALVPAWMRVRDEEGAGAAAAFGGRVLGTISLAVIAAALLLGLVAPLVVAVLAPGFAGTSAYRFAIDDIRLMLPYLAFAGPATVLMALLNARHRFALAAFAPVLFNAALLAVMVVMLARPRDGADAATIIAMAVGIAGLLQLAALALGGGASSATPLRAAFDVPMRRLLGKAIPGMIANAGPQLLIVAAAVVASASPSAISWLYFANRLIELPLGIVGGALGAVMVPELARSLRRDDKAELLHAQSRGLELAIGFALPAAIGLIVLATPIVAVLFEHGAFSAADSEATARVLVMLALGLPAQVLTKTLAPLFFARDDTTTPLFATLCGLAVVIVAGIWFGSSFGVAAAIALGCWSNAAWLGWHAAATFGLSIDAAAKRRLPLIVMAASVMGALLWLGANSIWPLPGAHGGVRVAMLGVLIIGGLAIDAALLVLFGVVDLAHAMRAIRRLRG